ncbi:hypothetical protein Clacol_002256 [Clathrus columnatus]|uniref:Uncharacterized protein n=1 Tax=Clathrus columnatus TaxID=1419009 RepID=A0AAV5A5M5_9AGAM|nr:hypothetical protein Clacol_002256 [Clathrus columnatus]
MTDSEKGIITAPSPFHALEVLGIMDKVNNPSFTISKALRHGVPFLKLVNLTCSPCCATLHELVILMESVHIVCPNLQEIVISSCSLPRLPCKAILALLQCPALHTLKATVPITDLALEHITIIVTNRTSWKNIALFPEKFLSCQPALIAFAQNCPDLVELGLTLNYDITLPDRAIRADDVRFVSLTTLNVGYSVINATCQIEFGMFLASICEHPLKILASGNFSASWKSVEKMVNSINTTAHVRTLNKKIALLEQKRTFNSISIQTAKEEDEDGRFTHSKVSDPDADEPCLVKKED